MHQVSSALYRAGAAAHRALYERGVWRREPRLRARRVVSVGNVAWGGSGKTPMCAWLAARVPGAAVLAGQRDERRMLARRGVRLWEDGAGADVVLVDDAFQRWRMPRDVDVVMLNGLRWPPERWGARERASAALPARAHAVVMHHRPVELGFDFAGVVAHSRMRWARPLAEDELVFAGVGCPESLGVPEDRLRVFCDHHEYSDRELRQLRDWARRRGGRLVTTEKDAARLGWPDGVGVIEAEMEVVEGGEALVGLVVGGRLGLS